MSVRLQEKSPQEGRADWWSQRQRSAVSTGNVSQRRYVGLYMHLHFLPDLTFFASEAHCVILDDFLEG